MRTGRKTSWLLPGMVALTVLIGAHAPAHADAATCTVQAGDVLGAIAERYDVSVDQLRQWNDLDGDTIRVGQELVVEPGPGGSGDGMSYEVREGETLSAIAARFGSTVDGIVALNPGLDPDRIRVGQELRIGRGYEVDYRVRRGDTLSSIASYHRVSVRELRRWNPHIEPDHIRIGARLQIYTERPPSFSESIGRPYGGRLKKGVRLPRHPAYVIRDRDVAWGTRETIDWLVDAFDHVQKVHPDAPRVRVHDLSDRDGGWLSGHKSHQSGRDADLAYYQERCPSGVCKFRRIGPAHLDVERQWILLEHWLEHDRVEAVFIDYELQAALYRHARAEGATRRQLHQWFQYPRGRTFSVGTIRHYPKHDDHLHVRFVCPPTDDECR